ncbi:undecaprenyl-diphosphatase [Methylopila capsulata]|uniref:Undecaprenyl-diphosphatase n=1 Tax=Methylopila capsulata TaxID=61654 RepID=A0A9W6IRD7_9HYPH|nr:undecaprenyl-diphosphate phosphatase [Methylopila capsulata]MBM7851204.1 undecaprenyl-diphosphatase [Methylopila capsulata]GLK54262.1 undecaprenyl-diphosphatase 1 [Methylopila capsulata]
MDIASLLEAALLGVVEGLTEFLPVSSTGHLLLLGHFLGFESTGKTFEVLIQLGAILAILLVYAQRLIDVARRIPTDPAARRFVLGVLIAFLPAAVIGAGLHSFIKTVLFETPALICVALIVGGLVLLWVDARTPTQHYEARDLDGAPHALADGAHGDARFDDAMRFPLWLCLAVGLCQCLALIPGVSRSGSTIVGALLLGASKRAAAEFSFFLSMPTMAGAFAYDLYKNRGILSLDDIGLVAVGFVCAFLVALVVVRYVLDFISKRGYAPFAWWRLIVGSAGLAGVLVYG